MTPCCQYCGREEPEWQLYERATGETGPEICMECLHKIAGLASDSGEADSNRPTDHTEPWRQVNPASPPTPPTESDGPGRHRPIGTTDRG